MGFGVPDRWLTFDCFGTLIDWRHGIMTTGELLFPGRGAEFLDAYVAVYKPSPAHFLLFKSTFGTSADEWIHVAQSYYHDIRPTSELGISRIWVNRQGESDDPTLADAMITGLAELPEAVREVSQAR